MQRLKFLVPFGLLAGVSISQQQQQACAHDKPLTNVEWKVQKSISREDYINKHFGRSLINYLFPPISKRHLGKEWDNGGHVEHWYQHDEKGRCTWHKALIKGDGYVFPGSADKVICVMGDCNQYRDHGLVHNEYLYIREGKDFYKTEPEDYNFEDTRYTGIPDKNYLKPDEYATLEQVPSKQ